MKTPEIESERLILKPIGTEQAEEIYAKWASDPRVTKYMLYNTHENSDVTRAWLSDVEKNLMSDTSYDWGIYEKSTGELIGSCGIYYGDETQTFEPGYNFCYDAWGKGYGTEVLGRMILFAEKTLGQTRMCATACTENERSHHVLEKNGFRFDHRGVVTKYDGVTKRDTDFMVRDTSGEPQEFTLKNGVKIPAIGYGSYKATDADSAADASEKSPILMALDAGYRYIDTASFYNNEEAIGAALKESSIPRSEIFLASKLWPSEMGYDEAMAAFERSCKKLGTDYLDLYLIHWPRKNPEDRQWKQTLLDTWHALEDLYADGRVNAIGVSNFAPHHLEVLSECYLKPMVNQLELHVGYMQEYTLQYCFAHGILPQAWSPLGRGRVLGDPHIKALASKYGVTESQLLLRYLNQRGISVIPKTTSPERMKENLDIFGFTIDRFDMSYLSTMPELGWSGEFPDWEAKV